MPIWRNPNILGEHIDCIKILMIFTGIRPSFMSAPLPTSSTDISRLTMKIKCKNKDKFKKKERIKIKELSESLSKLLCLTNGIISELILPGIYDIYLTVSDPYFWHFGIQTIRKLLVWPTHCCSENTNTLYLSCSAFWLAQLRSWCCVIGWIENWVVWGKLPKTTNILTCSMLSLEYCRKHHTKTHPSCDCFKWKNSHRWLRLLLVVLNATVVLPPACPDFTDSN